MAASDGSDKDELATPPKPLGGKRKTAEASMWLPRVGAWVKVVLDKRAKKNQALMDVPGVVSKVDQTDESVNILYPNKLSHYLHTLGQIPKVLFAIETYPMKKVRAWEGSTSQLDQILIHAMLHFVEQRGIGLSGSGRVHVAPAPGADCIMMQSSGKVTEEVDSLSLRRDHIKAGLKSLYSGENEASSSVQVETPAKTLTPQQESDVKREFTRRLAELFHKRDRLSRHDVGEALGREFPSWESLLVGLDAENKILIADDLVFRV